MPKIITNLWFDDNAMEAAEFYCSVFPSSEITRVAHYTEAGPGPAGSVVTVDFRLDGEPFTAINGGPMFEFTEAISLLIDCADQAEVDHYWDALIEGGEASQCGWLKDRFGLSWQVCPDELGGLLADPDPDRAKRAFEAMLTMRKIDIAAVRAAADARHEHVRPPGVDELCRLVLAARRLGCGLHLTDVDSDLRSLLELAGVGEVLHGCPAAVGEPGHPLPRENGYLR